MTTRQLRQALRAVHEDEAGQALTEYFMVVSATVIGIGSAFGVFYQILYDYYNRCVRWVTLPIP
jgi:hypothetical protein